MEDVANSERLIDTINKMDQSTATDIGEALGKWLASFHDWATKHADSELLETLKPNQAVQEVIHQGMDQEILDRGYSPTVIEVARTLLTSDCGNGRGVIYGDITTKKYGFV